MTQAPERKRTGRKPLPPGEGKTARVQLKLTPADKAAWVASAQALGLTLQAWIEQRCNSARRRTKISAEGTR